MSHWPSWTGFIRSKTGEKRWQWYDLALTYKNIEPGDKNFKVLLNWLQVCPYIMKYKTIWPWFSLKLNCHHQVEGFGETDTLGFLLIIPLGRWLQTGNFCNGANVKISRELNNYLVSFCDCRQLFSLPGNLPSLLSLGKLLFIMEVNLRTWTITLYAWPFLHCAR